MPVVVPFESAVVALRFGTRSGFDSYAHAILSREALAPFAINSE
jgi:hypothetical protein